MSFCTISGNNATFSGGGISINDGSQISNNVVIKDTILAMNTANLVQTCQECSHQMGTTCYSLSPVQLSLTR